ncbi:MAG TPA: ferritin [Candidatus Paceibacterota bacterium]
MLHEDHHKLSPEILDMKRAIDSLREEFEAVDWYQQRADATKDENLKGILLHNMHEELEHASMLLEWIRQQSPHLDKNLKEYLFNDSNNIAGGEKK